MAIVVKRCSWCKETKLVSEFSRRSDRSSGYKSHCRACRLDKHKTLYPRKGRCRGGRKKRPSRAAYLSAWLARNPGYLDKYRKRRRMRLYLACGDRTELGADDVRAWRSAQLLRQHNRCYWRLSGCHAKHRFSVQHPATEDHVMPLSRGGRDDLANLVLACRWCNASKGNRLLTLL